MSTTDPHDHLGAGDRVKDPVCGMTVDPAVTPHQAQVEDADYHFCSAGCRTKFVADPAHYLHPNPEQAAAPAGAVWTCPMHPEIRRDGPGSCPICGMALEPLEPSAEDGPNPELIDFTRRFWVAAGLAIPLVALSMGAEMFGLRILSPTASSWVQLGRASPIVLWAGWPFFQRGWTSVVTSKLNMFTLIALGVGAAYAYSLVATLAPALRPSSLRMAGAAPV